MTGLFLLTIFSGVLIGVVDLLIKVISGKKYSPQTQLCLLASIGAVFSFPILVFKPLVPLQFVPWFWMFITIFSYVLGNIALIQAYKLEDVSNVSLVTRLSVPLIFISGIIFFSESGSALGYFGIVLMLIGATVIFVEKKSSSLKGLLLAVFVAVLYTSAAVASKISLEYFDPYSYIFFPYLGVALITFSLPRVKKELKAAFLANRKEYLLTELLSVSGYLIYLISIKNLSLSIGNAVYESVSLFIPVILGIILLNEKSRIYHKIIGSLFIIGGVSLLGM